MSADPRAQAVQQDAEVREQAVQVVARRLRAATSGEGTCGTTARRYRHDPLLQAREAMWALEEMGWLPPSEVAALLRAAHQAGRTAAAEAVMAGFADENRYERERAYADPGEFAARLARGGE